MGTQKFKKSRCLDLNQGPLEYFTFSAKVCFGDKLQPLQSTALPTELQQGVPQPGIEPEAIAFSNMEGNNVTTTPPGKKMGCQASEAV